MMDWLAQVFGDFEDLTSTFSILDITVGLVGAFLLTALVGLVYRITHRGVSYSQSYVQTLVLMGVVVALIMMIVGSNIARAFSLVGALSIIRFRNAVKETRDVGFIFWAMAIGMACGTKFYTLAAVATVLIALVVLVMDRFDWFRTPNTTQILRLQVPQDFSYEHAFDDVFVRYTDEADLIGIDSVRSGLLTELLYSIKLKTGASAQDLLRSIQELTGNLKVGLTTGYDRTSL